jgi:hypothetical protein
VDCGACVTNGFYIPHACSAREIGGDLVPRLPYSMPRTISAAHHVSRSARAPDAGSKVADLLQALATVECNFAVGGPTGVPAGLLRDLVILTARLAGRGWLEANSESVADFTALYGTRLPPPLAELDQILASVLSSRFGAPPAATAA